MAKTPMPKGMPKKGMGVMTPPAFGGKKTAPPFGKKKK